MACCMAASAISVCGRLNVAYVVKPFDWLVGRKITMNTTTYPFCTGQMVTIMKQTILPPRAVRPHPDDLETSSCVMSTVNIRGDSDIDPNHDYIIMQRHCTLVLVHTVTVRYKPVMHGWIGHFMHECIGGIIIWADWLRCPLLDPERHRFLCSDMKSPIVVLEELHLLSRCMQGEERHSLK